MRPGPVESAAASELAGPDPIALFARAREPERFLWLAPDAQRGCVALGRRSGIETRGDGRFGAAERAAAALFARAEEAAALPLVGGFAFGPAREPAAGWSGFPDLAFWQPQRLLELEAGRARWIGPAGPPAECEAELPSPLSPHAAALSIESDEPAADYRRRIAAALREIERGEFEKVVLARRLRVRRRGGFDLEGLLRALASRYPSCRLFACAREDAVFLGASPEPLLQLRGTRVETAALAGSIARGQSPGADRELARALLESKKEQAEHAAVVRALRAALLPLCSELSAAEAPRLRRLDGIQHLETPLRGRLAQPASIFALADRLHPTPSVSGSPVAPVKRWLARHEELSRGWYAGGIGLVDARGEGELCVALRCALIRGEEAQLYAGAGIVAGSEPEAELRETRLKLRALLDPLLEV